MGRWGKKPRPRVLVKAWGRCIYTRRLSDCARRQLEVQRQSTSVRGRCTPCRSGLLTRHSSQDHNHCRYSTRTLSSDTKQSTRRRSILPEDPQRPAHVPSVRQHICLVTSIECLSMPCRALVRPRCFQWTDWSLIRNN